MSKDIATSIARNATVMMGSQMVTWVSSFVLMMFLPRYLGSEDYGRLYLAMSVAMIAQVFVDFGGAYYIAKEIARHRERAASLIADSIGFRIGLSILSMLLLALFSWIAGYSWHVQALILILAGAKLWEGPLGVFISAFQGFEEMVHRSVVSIVERVFLTGAGVTALVLGGSSMTIAVIMAASTMLGCALALHRLRPFVPRIPRVNWRNVAGLARAGLPYLMMAIFAVIYYRINAVMLSLMVPEQVVGWFGAAFRFFDILMFFPSILSMAVFPVLSRSVDQKNAVVETTVKSLEIILIVAIPLAIGTYAFSEEIIVTLFGRDDYTGSVAILAALAPGLILVYIDFVLVTALIAMDRQRQWSWVALAAIPFSVALNALLIPYFQGLTGNGGIGSAIATNITEFGILLSALWLLPGGFFPRERLLQPLRTILAGASLIVCLWGFRTIEAPWLLQAFAGTVVYTAAVLLTGALRPEDRAFVLATISPAGLRRLFATGKNAKP